MSSTPKTWPAQVRTAINPTERVKVTEPEYLDLERQGLLFEGTAPEATEAVKAAGGAPAIDTFQAPTPEADQAKDTTPSEGTDKKGD